MSDTINKDQDVHEETNKTIIEENSVDSNKKEVKAERIDHRSALIADKPIEGMEESDPSFKLGNDYLFVRVRFPGNARSQPFIVGESTYTYGQKVVAVSDRGLTVGHINSFAYKKKLKRDMLPARAILRAANKDDIEEVKININKEKKAELVCKRLIDKHNLDMNITHVEYIIFNKKYVFYFNAPERVDFRHLVKDLILELKTRIELRQISVRDRAAAIGAIGPCGLQTCCSSFLKNYGNVTIKMAKNQNLALLPNKINGVCGQIKCCIKYEDQVYTKKRAMLPREGKFIQVKNNDCGKVLKVHVLVEEFEMLTDKGFKRRYSITEYNAKDSAPPAGWKFPTTFDHIINEASSLIKTVQNVTTTIEAPSKEKISSADENLKSLQQENNKEQEETGLDDKKSEETTQEKKNSRSSNQRKRRRPNNKNKSTSASIDNKPHSEPKKHSKPTENNGQKKNNNQKRRFNKNNNRNQAPKKT